ncbi:F420-nonreducing hydrogenase [Methanomicrobiaceae archaeon CYW5]|uniref:Ni/Fe hydrogenase subunit alpha n=1 Tax=Methanovulcanius yangii TaxID=1789227 RepID=UPI0029CA0FA5|nr:Ni/Fe hydrogenase subunit alpha [Methanovulcanius yangii]MBT8507155.1 F420-nonreducing hydrogenase [Methanovulcanius yangii]
MKNICINPVTRIEGHAQVRIQLDDAGEVESAHFNVVELRGFEKFMIGAAVEEAPRITPRICGICPTSHHIASVKACDQIFGATVPPTAQKLRELLMLGQFVHSHSLHFFMLAAPDFLIGHEVNPEERNILGLVKKSPEIAKKAIEVRKFGQRLTEAIGGKPIHPSSAVPGGISHTLSEQSRAELLAMAEKSLAIAIDCWGMAKDLLEKADLSFGAVESSFMGLSNNGTFSVCEGSPQILSPEGTFAGTYDGAGYLDFIEEYSESWSYLKFARLASGNYYRVGPLARLNIVNSMGTPRADEALDEYRDKFGRVVQTTLAYNPARYIEFLAATERAVDLLKDPSITGDFIRTPINEVVNKRGVGIIEAPRGTLIHDYTVNDEGFIEKCNLIVATCQNNWAMDRGVEDVARKVVRNGDISESAKNQIEMVIRAYDPCISCATHAIKQMPVTFELVHGKNDNRDGKRIQIKRCL